LQTIDSRHRDRLREAPLPPLALDQTLTVRDRVEAAISLAFISTPLNQTLRLNFRSPT
jgi:hypothetical protein